MALPRFCVVSFAISLCAGALLSGVCLLARLTLRPVGGGHARDIPLSMSSKTRLPRPKRNGSEDFRERTFATTREQRRFGRMASSCSEARQSLLECLADSPCILAGRTIKECVKLASSEHGCRELNQAFFECKRGQVRCRSTRLVNAPPTASLGFLHAFTARHAEAHQRQHASRLQGGGTRGADRGQWPGCTMNCFAARW